MASVKVLLSHTIAHDPKSPLRWYVWTRVKSGRRKVRLETYIASMIAAGRTEHAQNIFKQAQEKGFSGPLPDAKPNDPAPDPGIIFHHFRGTATLNPACPDQDFQLIMSEFVQHLAKELGAEVKLRLLVEANVKCGLDQVKSLVVKEAAKRLGFKNVQFERKIPVNKGRMTRSITATTT